MFYIQKIPWRGYHALYRIKYHGGGTMLLYPKNTMEGVPCFISNKIPWRGYHAFISKKYHGGGTMLYIE